MARYKSRYSIIRCTAWSYWRNEDKGVHYFIAVMREHQDDSFDSGRYVVRWAVGPILESDGELFESAAAKDWVWPEYTSESRARVQVSNYFQKVMESRAREGYTEHCAGSDPDRWHLPARMLAFEKRWPTKRLCTRPMWWPTDENLADEGLPELEMESRPGDGKKGFGKKPPKPDVEDEDVDVREKTFAAHPSKPTKEEMHREVDIDELLAMGREKAKRLAAAKKNKKKEKPHVETFRIGRITFIKN